MEKREKALSLGVHMPPLAVFISSQKSGWNREVLPHFLADLRCFVISVMLQSSL